MIEENNVVKLMMLFKLSACMQYFLKAQFHFDKDEFADLTMIAGIAGAISQVKISKLNMYSCLKIQNF